METLQIYWWALIALLGALLVFLLFVQGGQTMLFQARDTMTRDLMITTLGRKWELTFTTLVVFGGAFFASFPLYYSTCFGGAYWLWMLILLSFVLQAFSYEFRRKKGNIMGQRVYDGFLFFNGAIGCIMLGVAVGMLFFGADFSIDMSNLTRGNSPVISVWADTHGLEAMISWRNLLLGFMVLMLARTLGALYFMNSIDDGNAFQTRMRRSVIVNGSVFVVLFLTFVTVLLTATGYGITQDGSVVAVSSKFAENLMELWWLGALTGLGVVMVLWGLVKTALKPGYRRGIWWSGIGTVLTVFAMLCSAGYNSTAYLASVTDPASSLTIANSSSSEFTLTIMTWVSAFIPVVVLYIGYVWYKMNAHPVTPDEVMSDSGH